LLTGKPPFDSDKTYEILDMVQNQKPAVPSEISKYPVPKILEELCLKCLSKDPADRPESMEDILQTLQQNWASELILTNR
jgi:serine/threonine-protein kinase